MSGCKKVAHFREIVIVNGDQAVARLHAMQPASAQGSFASRRLLPEFVALALRPTVGTDVTDLISDDRDRPGL